MSYAERVIEFWEEHPRLELIILAFALHGIFAPFTGLNHDIQIWIQVADDLIDGRNPYEVGLSIEEYYAYPPLWAYILFLMRSLAVLLGDNEYTIRYLIKLPMIVAQIASAWLGAQIVYQHKGSKSQEELTFAILLLNPFFYLIGSVWGMFDIIPAFFCLAMCYTLYGEPEDWKTPYRPLIAGICLSGAVLAKLYPIILLPLCLIYLRCRFHWVWFFLSFYGSFGLVCAPYFFANPKAFLHIFEFHAGRIGGGITYFNGLWLLINRGVISYETATDWSGYYIIPFVGALFLTYLLFLIANNENTISILTGTAMLTWVYSFSFKIILEQYIVWISTFTIIFLIIFYSSTNLRIGGLLIVILVPILYLTISVPFPDLFYIEAISKQREFFEQYSFEEKQIALFLLGTLLACFHFILWVREVKNSVQNYKTSKVYSSSNLFSP